MASVAIQAELVSGTSSKQGQPVDDRDKTFQQFQETYGPNNFENATDPDENQEDSLDGFDVEGTAFWDVLTSLSLLLLWFQRSTFGAVGLIRSLVLGHCLQLLFRTTLGTSPSDVTRSNTNDYEDHNHESVGVRKYFYMMQSLLLGNGAMTPSSPHKQVHGAWPPPALVALATLTIVALVVHPDGMTWIVLRKIRDALLSLLQSSTTCWAIMIRDYGVVGTLSASASIALVLLLAIAMHKAFLSNCCGSTTQNATAAKRRNAGSDKKRKRRKGRGRIKGGGSNPISSPPSHRLPKVEEVSSDGACDSRSSASSEVLKMVFEEPAKPPTMAVDPETEHSVDSQSRAASPQGHPCSQQEEEGASIMTSPSALESVVSEDFEAKGKMPVPSVCTVDTTAMSDDISCGSLSIRSVQQPPVRQSGNRTNKGKANAPRGGKTHNKPNRDRGQKQPKATAKVAPLVTNKTRAEGLKTAKPLTRASAEGPHRYDPSNKANTQKRNTKGKGGAMATQNSRGGRGKNGRGPKNQKNQSTPRTVSPMPTRTLNIASKTAATPRAKSNPTVPTGSPIGETKKINGNGNNNDIRLPPCSPYTQSLFSCEIGASGWSLPALPAVAQSTPAPSYQTNPFVTPYSNLPDYSSAGRNSPVVLPQPGTSLGLWNSNATSDHTTMKTPQRPLRAPPGLAAPPGFSESNLAQPVLSHAPKLQTPVRTPSSPLSIPVTPAFGTPASSHQTSPRAWSSMGLASTPVSTTSNLSRRVSSTKVKDNPFATATSSAGVAHTDESECKIEAELQELGGQMIGSILDF